MRSIVASWQLWAMLSAVFAALTAILGKIGIEGVDSDFGTLVRTVVIFFVLLGIVVLTGKFPPPDSVSARSYLFLVLSGIATGGSWLCYYRALKLGNASQVAPIDKLSVVLVALFGLTILGEQIPPRNWIGIGLIALGGILIASR